MNRLIAKAFMLIGIPLLVGSLCVYFRAIEEREFATFMRDCRQDLKDYECRALWVHGDITAGR